LQIEETLERLDLHLVMELWFSEQGFSMSGIGESQDRSGNGNSNGGIGCVSSRTLQLHLSPTRGLHYHLPILFDYFHLAAVTVTVHASLIAVHQPYIKYVWQLYTIYCCWQFSCFCSCHGQIWLAIGWGERVRLLNKSNAYKSSSLRFVA